MTEPVIHTRGLTKVFGTVRALSSIDFQVEEGTVLGLLGHNGAGKTTLVHILATLLLPTAGAATVAGFDVVAQARAVRGRIGLTGQYASVDEDLSGRDNLVLIGRLLGASRRAAVARADELLEAFGLTAAATRRCGLYSGGLRRRLDLAASLVGRPRVLFLDEPTTGLDPASRMAVWDMVRALAADGATVLLTTQYLDEADRLADRIAVLATGRLVATGTPAELKARAGGRAVHLTFHSPAAREAATHSLSGAGFRPGVAGPTLLTIPVRGPGELAPIVRALDEAALVVDELRLVEPSMDDVYLALANTRLPEPARGG